MSSKDLSVINNKDLNIDVIYAIIKNAGLNVEQEKDRLIIDKSGASASLFYRSDVINIYTSYSIKDDVDIPSLAPRLIELNGTHSFTKTSISEETRKLVVTMNYLTAPGIYVPHFILSLDGFFAFQLMGFERVDFSEILK